MKWFCKITAGAALVLIGLLVQHPAVVSAAPEGFNIITSPIPLRISTAPGTTIVRQLRLKNQGLQAEGIKVGLMRFGATGEGGQPDLFNLTPRDSYSKWVSFSPSQFTAQPNIWYSVTMTIKIPSTASLGYYLAATFSRASQPGVTDTTNLNGAVATLVLLNVKTANETPELKLLNFTSQHHLYEYLPANFSIKLNNPGNIYIAPIGNIFISRDGKPVSTINFNDAGGSVLPGSNRVYSVPWKDGFPVYQERLVNGKPIVDKQGIAQQNLKWDFTQASKFRFGKYTAKLLVVYNNGRNDVPLESSLSFWVIPWKVIAGLVGIIILLGLGLFTSGRTLLKKTRSGVSKIRGNAKS